MSKTVILSNAFDACVSRMPNLIKSYHCGYASDIGRNISNRYSQFGKLGNQYPYLFWVLPLEGKMSIVKKTDSIQVELHLYDKMSTEATKTLIVQKSELKAKMEVFFEILKTCKDLSFDEVAYFSDSVKGKDSLNVFICNFTVKMKMDCVEFPFEPIYNVESELDNELATG